MAVLAGKSLKFRLYKPLYLAAMLQPIAYLKLKTWVMQKPALILL